MHGPYSIRSLSGEGAPEGVDVFVERSRQAHRQGGHAAREALLPFAQEQQNAQALYPCVQRSIPPSLPVAPL